MRKSILLTSIALKSNSTMLDIESTRLVSQYDFAAKAFSIFEHLGISVDCVATSECKMSLALVPSKLWSGEFIQMELHKVPCGWDHLLVCVTDYMEPGCTLNELSMRKKSETLTYLYLCISPSSAFSNPHIPIRIPTIFPSCDPSLTGFGSSTVGRLDHRAFEAF